MAMRFATAFLSALLVVAWAPQAAAADLDNAVFNRLVNDLDSNDFKTRLDARSLLAGYADPASATRLSIAQLQSLRNIAKTGNLEVKQSAGWILREWVNRNPKTQGPAQSLLTGIQYKAGKLDFTVAPPEGDFMLGPFKVGFAGPGIQFRNDLERRFLEAQEELGAGYPDGVVPALQAMKKVVDDLKKGDLTNLYLTRNGTEVTKDDISKALDDAIKAATDLVQAINASIGDPAPGPAKGVNVPGMGAIDTGKTFQLSLNGPGLTPGSLTFDTLPQDLAIGTPPAGTQYFGPVFDLAAEEGLSLDPGSVITVSIQYGDPMLQGFPSSLAAQLQLVHLADGTYIPFSTVFNDESAFVLTGSYLFDAASTGFDQFGEFAVIRALPEPATITLVCIATLGLLWIPLSAGGGLGRRHRNPSTTPEFR